MIWSGLYLLAATLILYMIFWQVMIHTLDSDSTINIKRTMLLYATWIAGICALGQSGVLADFSAMPPRALGLLLAILVTAIFFVRSCTGGAVAKYTPVWVLVGFQGFRILAELALFQGYKEGIIPVQMTFEGRNFDVVTGVVALALIPILRKSPENKAILWTFNIMGLVLLANIVTVAVLSMPTQFRYFMNEPANTAVAWMPYILLPGVLVHAALVGHLLLTKKLSY